MTGCAYTRIPANYTPTGRKNFVEADRKINRENRRIKRVHRKMTRRIEHIQNSQSPTYINR